MKFTPTFKLKYKSKLSNFLKLRITLTLPAREVSQVGVCDIDKKMISQYFLGFFR